MSTVRQADGGSSAHTCTTCRVLFFNADIQRSHYKSDWHRYNLKRKVAELPPVTADVFNAKVALQNTENAEVPKQTYRCQVCEKTFQNEKTFDVHQHSKKHLDMVERCKDKPEKKRTAIPTPEDMVSKDAKVPKVPDVVMAEETIEADDGDDNWSTDDEEEGENDEDAEGLPPTTCLFCSETNENIEDNLKHMSIKHGFFLPDLDYCVDLNGLMLYLGYKVGVGFVCLKCNKSSRSFRTLDAVQKHMKDKSHCQLDHSGEAMMEYSDFYDYSTSYPDADAAEGEMEVDVEVPDIVGESWELVLPSGVTVGHRSLVRYYKQKLRPDKVVLWKSNPSALAGTLSHYRSLGWTGLSGAAAVTRAKDMKIYRKLRSQFELRTGVKANKFQPHFRSQIGF